METPFLAPANFPTKLLKIVLSYPAFLCVQVGESFLFLTSISIQFAICQKFNYFCSRKYNYVATVFKKLMGASLVAQWLGVCLPMQGTRVRALVWEDPTCRGATGPVSHNY